MARKFSELTKHWAPERKARVKAGAAAILAELRLDELRRARELTQSRLAVELDTTQAEVSKLERRGDMFVSTLRRYVRAMGGELELTARFPDGATVRITQFAELEE